MYVRIEKFKILHATPLIRDDCLGFYPFSHSHEPGEKLYIGLIILELLAEITFCTKRYVEALLFEVFNFYAGDRSLLNPAGKIRAVLASHLNELSQPIDCEYKGSQLTHICSKVGGRARGLNT